MLPRTTELQQTHKVEVFPAGARPPSVGGGRGAAGIGPKSDSCKDWLISIFAGSRAVIQRADGKLCNEDGGGRDWRGTKKGEKRFFSRERQRDLFTAGVFCSPPEGHSTTFAGPVCPFCLQHSTE